MKKISPKTIQLLESSVLKFNRSNFIENDPIQIPHRFSNPRDIEIIGFFAATLAWGQRITIINSCKKLLDYFDHAPHDFILNHRDSDLKPLVNFKHRTFNGTDLLYFVHFLKHHYQKHESLESAFSKGLKKTDLTVENALIHFEQYFSSLEDFPSRTRKHVATPKRKSACKRLIMYLRWMVRKDNKGVDFGIWNAISPSQLLIPFDVHVERVARQLQLIERKQRDFQTVLELTEHLRTLDSEDPAKFDFALFGLGIEQKSLGKR